MSSQIEANWHHLLGALRVEPREGKSIVGLSGIEHQVLGIGVDDKTRRIIIISAEHDARASALLQADVQASLSDARILVIRPVAVDLNLIARSLFSAIGHAELRTTDFCDESAMKELLEARLGPILKPMALAFQQAPLQRLSQAMGVLQQVAHIDFTGFQDGTLSLGKLLSMDFRDPDRRLGVCHLPLYEFLEEDWELFHSGRDIQHLEARLSQLGVRQYFFPPLDQTALGLVDRGISKDGQIKKSLPISGTLGHPLAEAEITDENVTIKNVVDALLDRGFLVEGEHGVEISEQGTQKRTLVRFRPREGLISKIINRVNLDIALSTKEWFSSR